MPFDELATEVTLLVPNARKTTLTCIIALTVETLCAQTVTSNAHEMLSESFEGHKVTPVKEFKAEDYEALLTRQPFCSEQFHQKEITRFFCFSCQACVCKICIVTDHRNHEIVLLDKAAHDEKPNIMSGAEMINERVNELTEVIRQFEETAS